ncbi:MAG: DUF2911 domain-containing protein [Flavobacteriales bacterium]|nr:DUF2911 domain-containing protein [Flavobacteriales bacterium]MBK7083706.1 DUF2911 domain-containing protein [Flavobacteriales bacterium]MBK7753538.1 DUF2911 domain-containing protein [Flavobacteriales bacterium]MBK9077020.1 DUF2911 domain-containing protein [Flavobacteriales bacterium]MBK9538441.1 DUF2911 domain-containing protein [Flavobacteriales bacterium]
MMRSLLALAVALPIISAAQDLPQPSPRGQVEQVVGLTNVKVDYSRPSAKGRKIFGDLVPFGQLWRTGANMCTTIELSGPVVVSGKSVAKGKYSLFTIPNEKEWTVILNSDTTLGGTDGYDEAKDVARFVTPVVAAEWTETFTIDLDEVKDDKARVDLRWENSRASFTVHADASEQALANIKEAMGKSEIKAGTYGRCARYCVDRGVMLPEALAWAEKSVSMDKKYWTLHTLALCQAANGKYKEAVATANESMAMAQAEKDASYVGMNKTRIEEWSTKAR